MARVLHWIFRIIGGSLILSLIILAFIFLFVFAKDAYSKILPTFVQKVNSYIGGGATNGIALNSDGTKIFVTKLGKVKETFLSIYDFILLLFLKPNKHNLDFHHFNIRREINLDDRF